MGRPTRSTGQQPVPTWAASQAQRVPPDVLGCWMPVSVTYREIAERFGIGIEGARLKAKRRSAKGLWRIVPGNHPQDVVRVEVPEDEWANPNVSRPATPHEGAPTRPPTIL